jgi:hypothetical protein
MPVPYSVLGLALRRPTHVYSTFPQPAPIRAESAINRPSQPTQGESNFGDSSGTLFSMYSKAAEDEDNKMAERWQKDAEGILIFVSLRRVCDLAEIFVLFITTWKTTDWFILRCRCRATRRNSTEPDSQQSGYLCSHSRKYLSASRKPAEFNPHTRTFPYR